MKKILFLLSFFVMAFSFQAIAQKTPSKKSQEITQRAIQRAAAKTTPQQELKKWEQKLVQYKKFLQDPAYKSEQQKIEASITMAEEKVAVLRKKLNK